MNFKKLLVSFVMLVSTMFLLSAMIGTPITSEPNVTVTVNDLDVINGDVSVIAGELITIAVEFTVGDLGEDDNGNPLSASDVRIKIELEGDKSDVVGTISSFDVESNKTYKKSMVLRVPYDLQDDLSEDLVLNLKIWNGDFDAYTDDTMTLRVQRPSYSVDFKSINTDKPIIAGETFSVDVVVKNTGYNKLDDVYVTVSIPELDIEKTVYAGDLFQFDGEDDDENTASVRVMIKIPYDVAEGVYNLEVEARNDDMTMNSVKEIFVKNDFSSIIIASGNKLLLLNPTGSLMALNLEVVGDATLSETVVVIPAGSSRTVTVSATGEYTVNVYTMSGNLVESKTLSASTETDTGNSVVTILTALLLVVFLVLLAVLVVLVTKKPKKDEEVSESYY